RRRTSASGSDRRPRSEPRTSRAVRVAPPRHVVQTKRARAPCSGAPGAARTRGSTQQCSVRSCRHVPFLLSLSVSPHKLLRRTSLCNRRQTMVRTLATASLTIAGALIAGGAGSLGGRAQPGANDVMALERSALDRWGRGDVAGFLSLYADGSPSFDPFQDRRIDGLAAMRAAYEPFAGKIKVDRY